MYIIKCKILSIEYNCFLFEYILKRSFIYSCHGKAEFSTAIRSSVSHDPSEIILICWFAVQNTFLIVISLKIFVVLKVKAHPRLKFAEQNLNNNFDPLQWMGAVNARVQIADKSITIIHNSSPSVKLKHLNYRFFSYKYIAFCFTRHYLMD